MGFILREVTFETPQAQFVIDEGTSQRTYELFDPTEAPAAPIRSDLHDSIRAFLGTTIVSRASEANIGPDRGRINRDLPLADPVYNCLFAEAVNVRVQAGEGYGSDATVINPDLQAPPLTGNADYRCYLLDVTFRNRPYPVVKNSKLEPKTIDFYGLASDRYRLTYYEEWKRFLHYQTDVSDTRISATVASAMRLRQVPDKNGNPTDIPFTGVPDMILPDSLITMTWYAVPERYLSSSNSYLLKYRGYINQSAFWKWATGSLLYLGVKVLRTYVTPTFKVQDQDDPVWADTFAESEKLVDLNLMFIHTTRTQSAVLPAPSNPNWLQVGHNLLPHFHTRKFWYATAEDADPAKQQPSYWSVPFEILFQDPDCTANLVTL